MGKLKIKKDLGGEGKFPPPKTKQTFKAKTKLKLNKITAQSKSIATPTAAATEPTKSKDDFIKFSPKSDEKSLKIKAKSKHSVKNRITKKTKQKFKKEELLKKVQLTKKAFQEDKDRKKREKTAVTGDMRPLADALPSLSSLFQFKSRAKTGVPEFDKPKSKAEKKQERLEKSAIVFPQQADHLKKVMSDEKIIANPLAAVAEALLKRREEAERAAVAANEPKVN